MQYEIVFKSDGCWSCYTCLPRTALAAAQTGRKTAAPGTGTGLLRWINVYSRTHGQNKAQQLAYKQTLTKSKKQYINT